MKPDHTYAKPETYGQFLNGNPCATCQKPEADHLTAYVVPLQPNRGLDGYLIVYAHLAGDALLIAEHKNYSTTGSVREATEADTKPVKVLRPWS
jgi:hypothetical protein